jgi:hypothetical protein
LSFCVFGFDFDSFIMPINRQEIIEIPRPFTSNLTPHPALAVPFAGHGCQAVMMGAVFEQ